VLPVAACCLPILALSVTQCPRGTRRVAASGRPACAGVGGAEDELRRIASTVWPY